MTNSSESRLRSLLSTGLEEQLLGTPLCLGLHGTNMFRLLGCQAGLSEDAFCEKYDLFVTRLNSRRPQRALQDALRTGFDELIDPEPIIQQLRNGMPTPNQRLVDEIFWPHVNGPVLEALRTETWPAKLDALAVPLSQDRRTNHTGAVNRHAAAVLTHVAAMYNHIQVLQGKAPFDRAVWENARKLWKQTLEDRHFWEYLGSRIHALGVRMSPDALTKLRYTVASVLQAFHLSIARDSFEPLGNDILAAEHFKLYTDGILPIRVTESLRRFTEAWIAHRLNAPLSELRQCASAKPGQVPYHQAKQITASLVTAMRLTWKELLSNPTTSQIVTETGAFDDVAKKVIDLLRKLNMSAADIDRCLHLRIMTMNDLASFPLSTEVRRKVTEVQRLATRNIYSEILETDEKTKPLDMTICHFSADRRADPDASIILRFYKVTSVTCAGYGWKKASILVPRSPIAAAKHSGGADFSKLAIAEFPDLQRDYAQIQRKSEQDLARLESEHKTGVEAAKERLSQTIEAERRKSGEQLTQTLRAKSSAEQTFKTAQDALATLDAQAKSQLQNLQGKWKAAIQPLEAAARKESIRRRRVLITVACISVVLAITLATVAQQDSYFRQAAAWTDSIHFLVQIRNWLGQKMDEPLSRSTWVGVCFAGGPLLGGTIASLIMMLSCFRSTARELRTRKGLNSKEMADYEKSHQAKRRGTTDRVEASKKECDRLKDALDQLDRHQIAALAPFEKELHDRELSWRVARENIEKATATSLRKLEELAVKQLKIRDKSKEDDHPMVSLARSRGFKAGEKPNEAEQQRQMSVKLDALLNTLDSDTRSELQSIKDHASPMLLPVLEELEKLPSHRRNGQVMRLFTESLAKR